MPLAHLPYIYFPLPHSLLAFAGHKTKLSLFTEMSPLISLSSVTQNDATITILLLMLPFCCDSLFHQYIPYYFHDILMTRDYFRCFIAHFIYRRRYFLCWRMAFKICFSEKLRTFKLAYAAFDSSFRDDFDIIFAYLGASPSLFLLRRHFRFLVIYADSYTFYWDYFTGISVLPYYFHIIFFWFSTAAAVSCPPCRRRFTLHATHSTDCSPLSFHARFISCRLSYIFIFIFHISLKVLRHFFLYYRPTTFHYSFMAFRARMIDRHFAIFIFILL